MKVETSYMDKPVVVYGLSFKTWSSCCGIFFIRERIYRGGEWTPYVKYYKRYATWFGYFKGVGNEG